MRTYESFRVEEPAFLSDRMPGHFGSGKPALAVSRDDGAANRDQRPCHLARPDRESRRIVQCCARALGGRRGVFVAWLGPTTGETVVHKPPGKLVSRIRRHVRGRRAAEHSRQSPLETGSAEGYH